MPGPLSGVRVIDLTSVALGPLATQMLGDMGADVIKVEAPEGDATRHTGPRRSAGMAAFFMGINRNKRSLVLDLKQVAARAALWRLVDGADVFIHSIRPQAVARLGFAPEAVLARNPRLVYAAVLGFGSGGPYAGMPAYDDVIQGQSGLADLMERLVGEPRYLPTIMADKTCALFAANAVMAALFERERSGQGQAVEIPMFESMVAFTLVEHLFGHGFDPPEGPMGYTRVLAPWRRPCRTRDGWLCMLVYTDVQWRRFWTEVGRPELIDDPRFDSLATRSANIGELYRLAGECVAARTTAEWVETLGRLDIPAAPMARLEDLPADPHLAATGFFRHAEHPSEGGIVMPDVPVRFGRTPAGIDRLQPKLGEHSVEVLREAGLEEAEIDRLIADRASLDGRGAGC
jgi:crotonobetainyl-CoA:carnitine CoA-transferase CaiB-like acyl-CoA transferase